MKRGRIPALQSRAGWCATQRSQSAAIRLEEEVGGVDPGGQLTASGGALRVDAIVGHRSADVAGVDPAFWTRDSRRPAHDQLREVGDS
jgi:hypothetical protein